MTERTAPTLDDVARAAGVSRATASRVINGAVPVSRPATEAVRKAVAESGANPADIAGTGRDGRLTKADVAAHVAKPAAPALSPAPARAGRCAADETRCPCPA